MSTTNKDTSDVKKAAEHADSQQIKKNLEGKKLEDDKKVDAPEELTKQEETPFIDEKVRTDK